MGNDRYRETRRRTKRIAFCLLPFLVVAGLVPTTWSFLVPSTSVSLPRQCTYLAVSEQPETESKDASSSSSTPICRIVSRADSKIPASSSVLPNALFQEPHLLEKLDAYYNAQAYKRTKTLLYLEKSKKSKDDFDKAEENYGAEADDHDDRDDQEKELVSVLQNSLEDAGFQLLSRRDLDLCDSLNVGYLLRLSISPALSELDPGIAQEFYPELFYSDGSKLVEDDEILFGGRCLVFWRGYSKEVTTGRLILPKLDYLQTSVVRRSAGWVKKRLDAIEEHLSSKADRQSQKLQSKLQDLKTNVIPDAWLSKFDREDDDEEYEREILKASSGNGSLSSLSSSRGGVNLGRYGGTRLRFVGTPDPDDALDPFMVCEVEEYDNDNTNGGMNIGTLLNDTIIVDNEDAVEHDLCDKLNHQGYFCEYDETMAKPNGRQEASPRIHLLERVSINNLVNIFTNHGRRSLLQTLFAKSKLVEPTYGEVVVVWRPMVKDRKKIYPPKFVTDLADIFDIDGFEQPPKRKKRATTGSLEIRNFQEVPMSNIQAVLPKTKLVFRPADALLFDTISLITFALVAGSIRLDSPRLDLLAVISVSLWIFRTAIRYSNKLARYDLLVKNFLTSKISHRNDGALKYLISEAGLQRAIRASLVHSWISDICMPSERTESSAKMDTSSSENRTLINLSKIQKSCIDDINNMLETDMEVHIDVDRALKDLEDLRLVRFNADGEELAEVMGTTNSTDTVKEAWGKLLLERNTRIREHKGDGKSKNGEINNEIASIMATNLLSNLEENRKPLQTAFKSAQEKGYMKVKEILEDEENRKAFESALTSAKQKGYKGYAKAKKIIKDKKSQAALFKRETRKKENQSDQSGGNSES